MSCTIVRKRQHRVCSITTSILFCSDLSRPMAPLYLSPKSSERLPCYSCCTCLSRSIVPIRLSVADNFSRSSSSSFNDRIWEWSHLSWLSSFRVTKEQGDGRSWKRLTLRWRLSVKERAWSASCSNACGYSLGRTKKADLIWSGRGDWHPKMDRSNTLRA